MTLDDEYAIVWAAFAAIMRALEPEDGREARPTRKELNAAWEALGLRERRQYRETHGDHYAE